MTFSQDIADTICDRIAAGESLRAICRDDGMPAASSVFKWLASNEAFAEQYARAREAQADALFDEILEISDDGRNDYMERLNHNGPIPSWEVNGEALARSRLRVDSRKWMAGKLRPKKYGDKLDIEQKTTLDASDPLMAMLEQVAAGGKRLVGSTNVSSGEDLLLPQGNEIAPEVEE